MLRLISNAKIWLTTLFMGVILLLPSLAIADQDSNEAWDKINAGALVVDVRTPEEFAQGHLANAINIPFEEVASQFAQRSIAKDTQVVVYCRSGRRSGIANDSLKQAGYSAVYNGGGYEQLVTANPQSDKPTK